MTHKISSSRDYLGVVCLSLLKDIDCSQIFIYKCYLKITNTHGKDHYNCLGTFCQCLRLVFCSSRDHPRSFRLVGDQNQSYGWPFFRGGQEWQAWGNFRCSAWRRFSLHDRHFQMATDRMTGIVPLDRAFNLVFLPHLIFKNWPMWSCAMFQNVQRRITSLKIFTEVPLSGIRT